MLLLLVVTGAPILFLFALRVLTPRAGPVFRFPVAEITPESSAVCSFELVPVRLPAGARHAPGQFVTVRSGALVRNYTLSSLAEGKRLRISVKREPGPLMSEHLHGELDVGSTIEVAGPLEPSCSATTTRPLVLVSAWDRLHLPALAMPPGAGRREGPRARLAGARRAHPSEHAFRAEARQLLAPLPNGFAHSHPRPDARDVDYDAPGRITLDVLRELPLPADAEMHLRPDGVRRRARGRPRPRRVSSESFGGSDPLSRPHSGGQTPPWWGSRGQDLRALGTGAEPLGGPRGVRLPGSAPATAAARPRSLEGSGSDTTRAHRRRSPQPRSLCCAPPDGDAPLDVESRAASCCRMTFVTTTSGRPPA